MTAIIVCSSWWTYWFIGCFTSCYILGGLLVWGRLRWVGRASDFPQWPLTQRWNFGPPPELQTPTDRFYGGRPWASCVCDVTVSSTLHRPNPGEYSSSSSAPPHTPLSLFLSLSVFLSVSLSPPAGRVMSACRVTTWETTTIVSSPSLTCQYKYSPFHLWWVQYVCVGGLGNFPSSHSSAASALITVCIQHAEVCSLPIIYVQD